MVLTGGGGGRQTAGGGGGQPLLRPRHLRPQVVVGGRGLRQEGLVVGGGVLLIRGIHVVLVHDEDDDGDEDEDDGDKEADGDAHEV